MSGMDFRLSDEQIEMKTLARDFAERVIKPEIKKREKMQDSRERYPWPALEGASDLGFRTLRVPKEYGGLGADVFTTALVAEEFAAADAGFTISFNHCWRDVDVVNEAGTEEQKATFFDKFTRDNRFLTAMAVTEAAYGSDTKIPYPEISLALKARPIGNDGWSLSGNKLWVSNGAEARMIFVMASTDDSKKIQNGSTLFMIPQGTAGLSVETVWEKPGLKMLNNAELHFEDCHVPREGIIGKVNDGFHTHSMGMKSAGALRASIAVGLARSAYEEALGYSAKRIQGGKPIIEHQAVGMKLARMYVMIESARTLAWRAAWAADDPKNYDSKISMAVSYLSERTCFDVCALALEILALSGVLAESPVRKYMEDASTIISAGQPLDTGLIRLQNLIRRELKT